MVSKMAMPAVTDPPGELMYRLMSRSGSSAASSRICAHNRLAMSSSTWVPRKMMRSRRSRSKTESVRFSPATPELMRAGVWMVGSLTVPTFTCRDVTVMHVFPNDTSQFGGLVSAARAVLR